LTTVASTARVHLLARRLNAVTGIIEMAAWGAVAVGVAVALGIIWPRRTGRK
jgi:hypothetical protein